MPKLIVFVVCLTASTLACAAEEVVQGNLKAAENGSTDEARFTAIKEKVRKNWFPVRVCNSSAKPVVLLELKQDGFASRARLIRSSGRADQDQAALKAVKDSEPFAPLPAGTDEFAATLDFNKIFAEWCAKPAHFRTIKDE